MQKIIISKYLVSSSENGLGFLDKHIEKIQQPNSHRLTSSRPNPGR